MHFAAVTDEGVEARVIWIVQGCSHVIHTADMFPKDSPKETSGLDQLLRACVDDGEVQRVVVTGSCHLAKENVVKNSYSFGEWRALDSTLKDAYWKALTEKEALDFTQRYGESKIKVTTIRSPVVMGPDNFDVDNAKKEIFRRLKDNKIAINVNIPVCDVRDVADAYIMAIENQWAVGKNVGVDPQEISFEGMKDIIQKEFGPQGKQFKMYFISTGIFQNVTSKALATLYGNKASYCGKESCQALLGSGMPIEKTIIDTVESYGLIS